jgi:hypothetical protein
MIASVLALGLVTGLMELATLSVAGATKPKTGLPCAPIDLRAIPLGVLAPNGTSGYLVALKNVSNSSCVLEGYPQFRMLNKAGRAIATLVTHSGAPRYGASASRAALITVKPGWSSLLSVSYLNSTNYPPATCPSSNRVEIEIPNMKEPIVFKWRIQPYGGKIGATPHCGEVSVSFVYGPMYRLPDSA